jgi:hypothetical protein
MESEGRGREENSMGRWGAGDRAAHRRTFSRMGPGWTWPSRPMMPIRASVAPSRHSATERAFGLACRHRHRRWNQHPSNV